MLDAGLRQVCLSEFRKRPTRRYLVECNSFTVRISDLGDAEHSSFTFTIFVLLWLCFDLPISRR